MNLMWKMTSLISVFSALYRLCLRFISLNFGRVAEQFSFLMNSFSGLWMNSFLFINVVSWSQTVTKPHLNIKSWSRTNLRFCEVCVQWELWAPSLFSQHCYSPAVKPGCSGCEADIQGNLLEHSGSSWCEKFCFCKCLTLPQTLQKQFSAKRGEKYKNIKYQWRDTRIQTLTLSNIMSLMGC